MIWSSDYSVINELPTALFLNFIRKHEKLKECILIEISGVQGEINLVEYFTILMLDSSKKMEDLPKKILDTYTHYLRFHGYDIISRINENELSINDRTKKYSFVTAGFDRSIRFSHSIILDFERNTLVIMQDCIVEEEKKKRDSEK